MVGVSQYFIQAYVLKNGQPDDCDAVLQRQPLPRSLRVQPARLRIRARLGAVPDRPRRSRCCCSGRRAGGSSTRVNGDDRDGRAAHRPIATTGPLRRSDARIHRAGPGCFLVAVAILSAFLMPLAYMTLTAFKDQAQVADPGAPLYPASPQSVRVRGRGATRSTPSRSTGPRASWRSSRRGGSRRVMIDPADPAPGRSCGRAAGGPSTPAWTSTRRSRTSTLPGTQIEFPKLLRNTRGHRDREHDRRGRRRRSSWPTGSAASGSPVAARCS